MNKKDARKIAETITNQQLNDMLENAKSRITDWRQTSIVNKGMTKGAAWNILGKNFDINYNHHILAKTNMVREFCEFLPDELKLQKPSRRVSNNPVHQDPIF